MTSMCAVAEAVQLNVTLARSGVAESPVGGAIFPTTSVPTVGGVPMKGGS